MDAKTLSGKQPSDDQSTQEFVAEPMAEGEKLSLACGCLLLDVQRLVTHVTSLWALYAQGKADLVAITSVSNCAMTLVQRLEEDFMAEFPEIGDVQDLLQGYYWEEDFGQDFDTLLNSNLEVPENIGNLQCAEYCFYPMFRRLVSFTQDYNPRAPPAYIPLQASNFVSRTPRYAKSIRERTLEDDQLFEALTPLLHWEVKIIQRGRSKEGIVLDPFLRALRSFWLRGGQLMLWHIAAGQCFLNALHATMIVPDKAFDELQDLCRAVKGSASRTISIDLETSARYARAEKSIRANLLEMIDNSLVNDPTLRFIAEHRADGDPPPPPPFSYLRRSPMLCGQHAWSLLEDLHMSSIYHLNRGLAVFGTAHPVNAVQQEGMCSAGWPELERMIQIQGEELIFVGSRPKTAEQYSTRYKLARGVSAVEFASSRHSAGNARPSREPRALNQDLPTSSLLRRWWSPGHEDINLTHVETLLNQRYESVPCDEAALLGSHREVAPKGVEVEYVGVRLRKPGKSTRKIRDRIYQTKSLTTIELLGALEASMTSETQMLKFDYLEIHRQCWRLMERIAIKMDGLIKAGYRVDWLREGYELASVLVPLILNSGSDVARLAKQVLRARDEEQWQSRFLLEAGKVVEEFLLELAQKRKEGYVGEHDEAAYSEEEAEGAGGQASGSEGQPRRYQATVEDGEEETD